MSTGGSTNRRCKHISIERRRKIGKLDLGSKYHGVKTLLWFIHNLLVSLQREYYSSCGANKYPTETGKYAWKYHPLVKA